MFECKIAFYDLEQGTECIKQLTEKILIRIVACQMLRKSRERMVHLILGYLEGASERRT